MVSGNLYKLNTIEALISKSKSTKRLFMMKSLKWIIGCKLWFSRGLNFKKNKMNLIQSTTIINEKLLFETLKSYGK